MICVSVQEKDFARCRQVLAGCRMAELRGDLCGFTTSQIGELVNGHPNILYTHRLAGGSLEKAREQVVTAIMKGAKYVDIEIEAPVDYLDFIKSYARANGCRLIISYHNFEGTQSLEELQTIYDICRRKGADIVKIVTTAHNTSDAARVMQLYSYKKSDAELVPCNYMERGEESGSLSNSFGEEEASLVAFCMGEAGQFTRHLCLHLGAPYTYAALDAASATAPGQYTAAQMEQLLDPLSYPYSTIKLEESIFNGGSVPSVQIPCSKSIAQRAILATALACGTTVLENFEPCNDSAGALEVIKGLGAEVLEEGNTLTIKSAGAASLKGISRIFTGESGLLARLLIPLSAYLCADGGEIEITGAGSILKRNLGESAAALEAAGAHCSCNGGFLPFRVSAGNCGNGRDSSGRGKEGLKREIEFSGKESSQIVSGFLMMLPLLENDTTLTVTNPASLPYIELTMRVLRKFGVAIDQEPHLPDKIIYHIPGGQHYTPTRIYLDSDWSSAANFAVAGALLGGVVLKDMPVESAQADEKILEICEAFGCRITKTPNGNGLYDIFFEGRCRDCGKREEPDVVPAVTVSLQDCPDLFPIVALLACNTPGETILQGVGRLAQKESNRAESIYSELARLGYGIRIDGDNMYLCGSNCKADTDAARDIVYGCGHNDHRIAMMLHIAALAGGRDIRLDNIKCMDKSFPSFAEKLKK